MKKKIFIIMILVLSAAIHSQDSQELQSVKFGLHWFPQAQFAGFIMAYEKGFYEAAGLDVQLEFFDGSGSPLNKLVDGEVDFCTAWLSQTIALKSEGAEIVNLCQILQKSSLILVAKKDSGIEKPEDMNGKRISLWSGDFSIQPTAFFSKYSIEYEEVPQSYNIQAFLADAWDVASAMYYNEYYKIILSGVNTDELNAFFFSDYDLNFPEDGIYCTEATINQKSELCREFCAASLKGWEYAFNNKKETLTIVMNYCDKHKMQTNLAAQSWMLQVIEESMKYQTGENASFWGILAEHDYNQVGEILLEQGLIKSIPPYQDFYKGRQK
ncbi:MAG: ABC transporter substrate-binding protein [Candidatus Cloacimonadales bacterium]|nr:ABC transporter substrate-binding protein [Candidatus Cloacimonadales bacterium]